jgi:hypothetical protein
MEMTSTFGWNFSKTFGIEVGIPIYLAQPTSRIRGTTSATQFSNVFADVKMLLQNPLLKTSSTLTATAPTGDTKTGLSTGRATVYFDNRFEHEFGRLTPFLDIAVGNSIGDGIYLKRPYITLGKVAHFEAGPQINIWRSLALSTSLYADVPWGDQKIYSRVIRSSQTGGTSPTPFPKGIIETVHEAAGNPNLTRDNGYTVLLTAGALGIVDFDLGYTRSVPFRLDTVSFGIGFDFSPFFKKGRVR